MTDINNQNNIEGQSPLDKGKKTIDEVFEELKKRLLDLTFISNYSTKNKIDEYLLPKTNKFLYQKWNRTYMVEVKKGAPLSIMIRVANYRQNIIWLH